MARRRVGKKPKKGIDATAGGLVWVRRRNGSWWPGQILDPIELPEDFAPTPRPGTPVQFLGREDASVDWYNLEKSKRVKPFHCKEYEYCIQRAQMSATQPFNNRAVKYARREDAILHALELEKTHLGKKQLDLNATPDTQESDDEKDLNSPGDESESGQEDGPGHVDTANEEHETEIDSEDDGVKRMRGLEDLGMGLASTGERKLSQAGHVPELLKRAKRRPLMKVMECSTMIPVFVRRFPAPTGEDSNESKKNSSVVINNNSDSAGVSSENASLKRKRKGNAENGSSQKLLDVPVTKRKNSAVLKSDASRRKQRGGGGAQSSRRSNVKAMNEACDGSGSTRSGTANANGTLGWVLKGKRKARSRRWYPNIKIQTSAARAGRGGSLARSRRNGAPHNANGGSPQVKSRPSTDIQGESPTEQLGRQRLLPLRQSRFTVNPKYNNSDYCLDNQAASSLYDVKVEVKTSYRPQNVPYVSLVSQLTSLPITGYPIQVKVLKDGYDDQNPELGSGLNEEEVVVTPSNASKRKGQGGKSKRGSSSAQISRSKSRRSGLLSKKTRKLSSLTGAHRLSYQETNATKPIVEKLKTPSVACVPLNVVFSRLNAALK
ncbi:hypothetical protein ACS0TY_012608 [Phlomoides rotata]